MRGYLIIIINIYQFKLIWACLRIYVIKRENYLGLKWQVQRPYTHLRHKKGVLVDREGGGGLVVSSISIFLFLHIQKGFSNKSYKLYIRNLFSVTMLKHINFYKKELVIIYTSCLQRLILSLLFT